MPVAALVVGQDRIDRGVVEEQHFLAGVAVVVFGDEVRDRRSERRAVALSDEADAGIDRLLQLNQRLLGIKLIVVGDDFELAAEHAALRVGGVGKIIEGLETDFADAGAAAGQRVDVGDFDRFLRRGRHRGDDSGSSGAQRDDEARRHRDPPKFLKSCATGRCWRIVSALAVIVKNSRLPATFQPAFASGSP